MSLFSESPDDDRGSCYSVAIGIVTNNKDPDGMGRVKLRLPDRLGTVETDWARIAVAMAGKEMGSFLLPEVGDEVLVAFCDGDIREPYVLGCLWNAQEKPPETNADGKNNIRKLKSRSGHEIIIDDSEESGGVEIRTKNGASLKIENKDSGVITVKDKSGSNSAVIDGNGKTVKVQCGGTLSLEVGGNTVTIDGNQNSVAIKSAAKLSIEAQMIDVKAGASMNLSSDGMLTIKGSMVKIN